MAREWISGCKNCGKELRYSDFTHRAAVDRGQAIDDHCTPCTAEQQRAQKALPMPEVELQLRQPAADQPPPLLPIRLPAGPLGEIPVKLTWRNWVDQPSSLREESYGITNERLLEMYRDLQNPAVRVMIVEAPTGSGKSTFLPYRLLNPPPGIDPEIFTRRGQIVVTQPRQKPTRDITRHVARDLHGSSLGAGFDLGYAHRGARCTDDRTRMAYLTDGMFINRIVNGQLGKVSLIVIDEAHERSLNIDVIIGMLAKLLPRYPQLKLLIASATINVEQFQQHFNTYLPGGNACRSIRFAGKQFGVTEHFHPDDAALPYELGPSRDLRDALPKALAGKVVHLLKRMMVPGYQMSGDVGGDLTEKRGDIVGFLQGEKPIDECLQEIKHQIESVPELRDNVDLKPLFRELPQAEQDRITDFKSTFNSRLVDSVLQQFEAVIKSDSPHRTVVGITPNAGQLGHAVSVKSKGGSSQDGNPDDFVVGDLVQRVQAGLQSRFPEWQDKTDVLVWFQGEAWKPHGWLCPAGKPAVALESLPPPTEDRRQIILSTAAAIEARPPPAPHVMATAAFDKVRVVVATNIAETSLTIHGVLHVVDSGVINLSQWDIRAEKSVVGMQFHSRAGCRQRWGRAGRLQPGDAWPLYTRAQFESFAPYSVGEILRAGLEQTLLKAKIAGIDDVSSPSFPWFEPPPPEEYQRALLRLAQNRAIDGDGDPTEIGNELDRNQGNRKPGQLLMYADRLVCALEMAAILPFFADRGVELKKLFLGARRDDSAQQARIGLVHQALRSTCQDDLDLVFKLFASWLEAPYRTTAVSQQQAWKDAWAKALNSVLEKLPFEANQRAVWQARLSAAGSRRQLQPIVAELPGRNRSTATPKLEQAFDDFSRRFWADAHYVDHEAIQSQLYNKWNETLTQLSAGKKDLQERRELDFELLETVRCLVAWSLPENCFVRQKANNQRDAGACNYVPLGDQEAQRATYRVEVGNQSICASTLPEAFVCAQRNMTERRPHAQALPEVIARADIVMQLDRKTIRKLTGDSLEPGAGLTFWQLVQYLAKSKKALGQPTRRRLMIDQYFPLGCEVSCRLTSFHTVKSLAEVQVLGVVTAKVAAEVTAKSLLDDDESRSGREEQLPPAEGAVEGFEDESPAEMLHDPEDDESFEDEAEMKRPAAEPRSYELNELYANCPGVVDYHGDPPNAEFNAEVCGYDLRDPQQPKLLLRFPARDRAFQDFSQKHQVGHIINVRALDVCDFPLAGAAALRVLDLASRLEILMHAEDLSHASFSETLKLVPKGAEFRVTVTSIDSATQTVRVDTHSQAEKVLANLDDEKNRLQEATVLGVSDRNIKFLLKCSQPSQGIFLAGMQKTFADQSLPTTYLADVTVLVLASFKKPRDVLYTGPAAELLDKKDVLQAQQIEIDEVQGAWALSCPKRLTVRRWKALQHHIGSCSQPVEESLRQLFHQSNRLHIEVTLRKFAALVSIPTRDYEVNKSLLVGPRGNRAIDRIASETGTEIKADQAEGLVRLYGLSEKSIRHAINEIRKLNPYVCTAEVSLDAERMGSFLGKEHFRRRQLEERTSTSIRSVGAKLYIAAKSGTNLRTVIQEILGAERTANLLKHLPPIDENIRAYNPARILERKEVSARLPLGRLSAPSTPAPQRPIPKPGPQPVPAKPTPAAPTRPATTSPPAPRKSRQPTSLITAAGFISSVALLLGFVGLFCADRTLQLLLSGLGLLSGALAWWLAADSEHREALRSARWAVGTCGFLLFCSLTAQTPIEALRALLALIGHVLQFFLGPKK